MSWSADPHALEQLKHIFSGTLSSDNRIRAEANEALSQARLQPEIENYLCDLLINDKSAKSDVRAAAGINLKNSVLRLQKYGTSTKDRTYLLQNIFKGLVDEENMVRNITGNVITSLFSIYGISGWPQALPQLIELSNSKELDLKVQEASLGALSKICEDSASVLDQDYNGERPLNFMISNFLKSMDNQQSGKIRSLAIHCINQFIPLKTQSFLVYIDDYLGKLFTLANDSSSEVRRNICTAFLQILETRADKLMPHLDGVINYCLHLMQDSEEEVALEACEFILALSTAPESENDKQVFKPKLKTILPVLLAKMVYSEQDIFYMQMIDDNDDAHIADKDEDIRPQAAKSKEARSAGNGSDNKAKKQYGGEDESDSDDDDDDDDDDDSELDQWSLRKCSAATLDILSLDFPSEVLEVTLPILQENIVSDQWPVREASILAFGAISKSCMELASDKLPTLVPYLVDRLQDKEPRVRQITCWTISRFAGWVSEEAHEGGNYSSYFQPTFESIVSCALDNKKVVQEAACSALSSFIEEADVTLIDYYLGPLLTHFAKCFQVYQRKNMRILYDCVQTFVEKVGQERLSSKPEYVETLLPPLLGKWQTLSDTDEDLWPLLECMASVAATLGELFTPYALSVYQRAIKILANSIELDQQCQTDPYIDAPEKDFIIASLDLIDGLIQGFTHHSAELIQQNEINLMDLVMLCFEDPTDDVRQSAYALLGDLAIFIIDSTVRPRLQPILVCIGNEINNRTYNSYAVYNNAIWSLGEIVMRLPYDEFKAYLNNLVNLLIPVLSSYDALPTVAENAAICLGRMGIQGGAEVLAPRLPEFIYQWCSQMLTLVDNNEKETAFSGMLNIIKANPDQGFGGLSNQQGKKNLSLFILCIGYYAAPPDELRQLFSQVLVGYANMLGKEVWEGQVLSQIDGETRQSLHHQYGI